MTIVGGYLVLVKIKKDFDRSFMLEPVQFFALVIFLQKNVYMVLFMLYDK